MNAIEFIAKLKDPKIDDMSRMTASKYFDTLAGKEIIRIISEKASDIDNTGFKVVDYDLTKKLKKNPLYKGRKFFDDMHELGFSCEVVSYHQDEMPVKTYQFKRN